MGELPKCNNCGQELRKVKAFKHSIAWQCYNPECKLANCCESKSDTKLPSADFSIQTETELTTLRSQNEQQAKALENAQRCANDLAKSANDADRLRIRAQMELSQANAALDATAKILREAADSVHASLAETDISDDRKAYRKGLELRLRGVAAALTATGKDTL